jgi:CRP/FNR family transcriptional regulator, cyclic AMP receptor protein
MVDRQSKLKMLGSCPLFQDLSKRELSAILKSAHEVEHPAGIAVLEEGTDGVGFHLILEGKASVVTGGRRRAELGPGQYFGEMSLIDGLPRTATVTPITPMKTLTIASWDFAPMVDQNPSIARKMLAEMSRRLREAYKDSVVH